MLNPTRASGNASPARPAVPSPEAKTAQAVQLPSAGTTLGVRQAPAP